MGIRKAALVFDVGNMLASAMGKVGIIALGIYHSPIRLEISTIFMALASTEVSLVIDLTLLIGLTGRYLTYSNFQSLKFQGFSIKNALKMLFCSTSKKSNYLVTKNAYYLIPNLWKSKAREHGLCMAWLILKPIVWIWNASIVLEILTGLNSRQGFSFYALKRYFNSMPYITTFLLASPIFMLTCIYPGR